MNRLVAPLLCLLAIALVAPAGTRPAGDPLPPGHPPATPPTAPQLPPGHPPARPPADAPGAADAADPADVASIGAIVNAYYDSISGPAGQPRNWPRFNSLFSPEARFVMGRGAGGRQKAVTITPAQFAQLNGGYFERSGYFEGEVHRQTDAYGCIAHVFSTYASRRNAEDPAPYSRGINSIQLFHDGRRWWIITVMWDFERPGATPIPPQYLPPPTD